MGILGSVTRYLKARGRLLYTESVDWGTGRNGKRRRNREAGRSRYLEAMEPRVLMTTVFGGETFTFTDASGNTVTAGVNGNAVAELVGAKQTGGKQTQTFVPPATANEGVLVFGDIVGVISGGPRNGTIIGNGSLPVTGRTGPGSARINVNSGTVTLSLTNPQRIHLSGIASNSNGQTFAFNWTDLDAAGQQLKSTVQTDQTATFVQIIRFNATNNHFDGSSVTVKEDQGDVLFPAGSTDQSIPAAAFNPIDGLLYFDVHYTENNTNNNGGGNATVDEMWSFNPQTNALTPLPGNTNASRGALIDTQVIQGKPQMDVKGMTFIVNPNNPTTATLYIAEQPGGQGTGGNQRPPLQPRLDIFDVATNGSFSPTTVTNFADMYEGWGGQRVPLTNVEGITSIPGSVPGGGANYIYAIVGSGQNDTTTHLVRLDTNTIMVDNTMPNPGGAQVIEGTGWGNTTDLYQSTVRNARQPFDGQSAVGLTYNPLAIDPFTRQRGAFMFMDVAIGANGGASTVDLCYANKTLHMNTADAFSVYSNTSDINSSIALGGSTLYTNQVNLGFNGQLPDNSTNDTFTAGSPFITGQLNGSVGMLPGLMTSQTTGQPSTVLNAGLYLGHTLEQTLNTSLSPLSQTLGTSSGFDNVTGMAISSNGLIAVINSNPYSSASGTAADQLGFVDPTTGALVGNPVNVHLANGTPLQLVEGLAFGGANGVVGGADTLYAVYDGAGGGPVLGTINIANGVFTVIGALGLGAHAQVTAMGFTPGPVITGTANNLQGLYVIADPNMLDTDPTAANNGGIASTAPVAFGAETLYRVNVTTGAVLNAPTFGTIGNLTSTGGIGQVVYANDAANGLTAASLAFDAGGRALVFDKRSGRLMDLNVATGVAGANFTTQAASFNATVAGVAFDPATEGFFAIDNMTGNHTLAGTGNTTGSAILMQVKDFSRDGVDPISLGKFLLDGTFTGSLLVTGSMDTFFADDVRGGDASAGGSWRVPGAMGDGSGTDSAAKEGYFHNNMHFGGDIRNFLSLNNIGVGTPTQQNPTPYTGFELTADGKIGWVRALGVYQGVTRAGDGKFVPGISDQSVDGTTGLVQTEVQHFYGDNTDFPSFAAGFIIDAGGRAPFANTTFQSAQYLGSIRNATAGQPDVIHLQGILENGPPPNPNPQNRINQPAVDYFAFGLLAGQTVDIQVTEFTNPAWTGTTEEPLNFGIFDPSGRLIATDFSDVDPTQVEGRTIRITATMPGAYRVAIQTEGGTSAFTGGGITNANFPYELTVKGIGDLAIGGVQSTGNMILAGSNFLANDTNSATIANPSIWADLGDVGAIVTPAQIQAPLSLPGFTIQSTTTGYSFSGDSSSDITVSNGNLRVMQGGVIGPTIPINFPAIPDLNINGNVGLLQSTTGMLAAYFSNAANGNIQMLDSVGDLAGIYRANKSIGVIRAATVANTYGFNFPGNTPSEFHADADRQGNDGIIDLIDVTGNWGGVNQGGASLVTGPGGDVRFMNVGGVLWQDPVFSTGATGTRGEIVHNPGPVSFNDDSGAKVTLTPGNTSVAGDTTGTLTSIGVLTTRVYGVRGAGGVVICDVTSTGGLTVNVDAGGSGRSAEVTNINVGGGGIPLIITNGVPSIDTTQTTNTISTDVLISSSSNARVDVFDITNGGPANGTGGGNTTIGTISNSTGGDIFQVTAGDIGSISSHGNIGVISSTSGAELNPVAVFSNAYPFINQHHGLSVGNVGTISADKGIGNIIASGVIGTITANKDGVNDPNTFEGIVGPIVVNGIAASATTNTDVGSQQISLSQVNIGEGIAPSGSGTMSLAGIYAAGGILKVSGGTADIRGSIVSQRYIGTVTLASGSIINTHIMVPTSFVQSSTIWPISGNGYSFADLTTNIDQPVFNIGSVSVGGGGGIIGTFFLAASAQNISVAANGFGIFNSVFLGIGAGTYGSISAGGYGIQDCFINNARVNNLSAIGSGAPSAITSYSPSVRASEHFTIDPFFGIEPSQLTDIDVFLLGDAALNLPNALNAPNPNGLTTGVIWDVTAFGQDRLGTVGAFDLIDSSFQFPVSTGAIAIRDKIDDTQFVTGKVASLNVAHDVTNLEMTAAGSIGPVNIGGSFLLGTNQTITSIAQILAKGPSGSIQTMTVKGDVTGTIGADSNIGTLTIGGNFGGNIFAGGNHVTSLALGLLKLLGSIVGGSIVINGNAGTIDVAHDFLNLAQDMVVNGNVGNLFVGDDTKVNGSVLGAPLTINGNLTNAVITGAMTGTLIVRGNVSKFAVNADPATVGTNVLSGGLVVSGALSGLTVQGGVSGNVEAGNISSASIGGNLSGMLIGGKGLSSATISGNVAPGASVGSSLGDVSKLTIAGNLDGSVTAPNGALASVTINGTVDPTAVISGRNIGTLSVPGTLGGAVTATNQLSTLKVGAVAATAIITAQNLTSLTTKGDLLGTLSAGTVASSAKLAVGGSFGANASFGGPVTATINGNMNAGSSFTSTNNVATLTVKGAINGDVIVDKTIGKLSAAAMNNAVITGGLGISSIKITGAVNNSLIQAGLAPGGDRTFGTNDLGEEARMADLGSMAVGSMNNSIVAAGGNIGTFTSKGAVATSSVSSAVVLLGSSIAAALADATPLADETELDNAQKSPTLFHGNIKSAGASSWVGSSVTAGVSAGVDGAYGTSDDNANTSRTGGNSSISSVKGAPDAASHVLANTSGGTKVTYTLDGSAQSIVQNDPVTGAATAVASPGVPATITTANGTITVTVSGDPSTTVSLYDNPATDDRLDTMVISSTSTKGVSVAVTTTAPGLFDLGRVLATDNTQVASFTFNGDILGDVNGGPSLWIDSDMSAFTARNMPNNGAWSGQIGGNVAKLTLNQQGPGQLRIGGRVTTLAVASSVGNPLLQQLGELIPAATVSIPTPITPIAPGSTVAGKTIGEWTADWWNWEASFSTTKNPVDDLTGEFANLNQPGPVFFVAGANTSDPVNRAFDVPANTDLMISLPSVVVADGPDTGFSSTLDEASRVITNAVDPSQITFTVDGIAVPDLAMHREVSPLNFTLNAAANNPIGIPTGSFNDANADGYWIMLPALAPGQHVLHIAYTTAPYNGIDGVTVDQTDTITVKDVSQMSIDPVSGKVFATDGTHLISADIGTGAVSLKVPVQGPLSSQQPTLDGLSFDSIGNLYGVATLNNQNPVTQVGQITTTGDTLRGLAVNSLGQIFAIDSSTGLDTLVQLDPTTGAETKVGTLRDPFTNTFSNNILALAFDANDNLLALVNDRDGNGTAAATSDGVALAKIATTDPGHTGFVRISNPTSNGSGPVAITGAVTSDFTGLAVRADGVIFAVRSVGGVEELDTLAVSGSGPGATVALTTVGNIKLDAGGTDTQILGMGFDEDGNLLAMNVTGAGRDLIAVDTTAPDHSLRVDVPGLIATPLAAFAMGRSGASFKAYGYTTDPTDGGILFVSPGVQPTLVQLTTSGPSAGSFVELLPLTQDDLGTPLAGNVQSIAVDDGTGNIYALTDQGIVAKYSAADGSLIGGAPIGVVQNSSGAALSITRIAFDATGDLIGLNASGDNLVRISTTTSVIGGRNVALATNLTDLGTVDTSELTALAFSPALGRFVSYSRPTGAFVSILGTTPAALGGIIANSYGTVSIASQSGGRIVATGNGAGNSIDSLAFAGAGTFSGNIISQGGIGKVAGSNLTLAGAVVTHGDLGSVAITGATLPHGVIAEDGLLKTFTFAGSFGGSLQAARASNITINGAMQNGSSIVVANDVSSVTVAGSDAGAMVLGSVKTLKVNGLLAAGGRIAVMGDASSVTLAAGTELGSLFLGNLGISSGLTVGGTLAGTVATRMSVKSVTLASVATGLLDIGGDLASLTIKGNVAGSLIAVGTWIGADGVYNTADDVIFGGSLASAKIGGGFADSLITAGVLPRQGVAAGNNNIPVDFHAYTGNPVAPLTEDVDSAESGGIATSTLGTISFAQQVVSDFPDGGIFSALVAADGLGKITAKGPLQQVVRTDPAGVPQIVTSINPTTGLPDSVVRFSPSEFRITFDQPLDSATLNNLTVQVFDKSRGIFIPDLTFGYFNQTAADGSTQGVLEVISGSSFGGATTMVVTLQGGNTAPTIADRTGLRSSLFDYNQDGTIDAGGDPFGTTIVTQSFDIQGIPTNDDFENAIPLTGLPVMTTGTNLNATLQPNEPFDVDILGNSLSNGSTVWWKWTAPSSGPVTISAALSSFGAYLNVYTGQSLDSLTKVTPVTSMPDQITFNAVAGTIYRISVDGLPGESGDIALSIS